MRESTIERARKVPPEILSDYSEEDPQVLSSFFPRSFHTNHKALLEGGWLCEKRIYLAGREMEFIYRNFDSSNPLAQGDIIYLRYIRQRKGIYYCQGATVNGLKRKLAQLLEDL